MKFWLVYFIIAMFIVDRAESRKKTHHHLSSDLCRLVLLSLPLPPLNWPTMANLDTQILFSESQSCIFTCLLKSTRLYPRFGQSMSARYTLERDSFLRNSDATPSKWNVHYNVTNNLDFFKVPRLEGLMLKLKLQYFGHLMWRVDSLEKTLILGGIGGRRRRGRQDEMVGWHHRLDGHEFE